MTLDTNLGQFNPFCTSSYLKIHLIVLFLDTLVVSWGFISNILIIVHEFRILSIHISYRNFFVFFLLPWRFGPFVDRDLSMAGVQDIWVFTRCGCKLYAQPPNRSARVILFVRHRVPNLSGIGGPKSSRAAVGFLSNWPLSESSLLRLSATVTRQGLNRRTHSVLGCFVYAVLYSRTSIIRTTAGKKYHILSSYTWFREKFKIILENKPFQVYVTCFHHVITFVCFLLFM
jgi:hypothetical protein